jgi:hypothetical protein
MSRSVRYDRACDLFRPKPVSVFVLSSLFSIWLLSGV